MANFQMDRNFLEGNDFARFWKEHKSITISGNWCSNSLTSFISTLLQESRLLKIQNFTIHVVGRLHWLLPRHFTFWKAKNGNPSMVNALTLTFPTTSAEPP
uniref:Uncharacterized protein n=1 Tax=Panagrolaimus superbus TaxID=310955 RepID=A0A914YCI1_9BILA